MDEKDISDKKIPTRLVLIVFVVVAFLMTLFIVSKVGGIVSSAKDGDVMDLKERRLIEEEI